MQKEIGVKGEEKNRNTRPGLKKMYINDIVCTILYVALVIINFHEKFLLISMASGVGLLLLFSFTSKLFKIDISDKIAGKTVIFNLSFSLVPLIISNAIFGNFTGENTAFALFSRPFYYIFFLLIIPFIMYDAHLKRRVSGEK